MIYTQKYDDPLSQIFINNAYIRSDGGSAYQTHARVGQSPDGTKVAWHSEFLNGGLTPDIFWSVAYYPTPPTNLSASSNNGARIEWVPPKYTERGWPFAQLNPTKDALGWPSLDGMGNEIGEPLYAREIKRYHIWRSPDGVSNWQEVGAVKADYNHTYLEDSNLFMLHPVVNGFRVGSTNKITFTDKPGEGTFFYAVTSEEHSGLESNELSEIIRVTVSGGNVANQTVVQPKGQRDFWRTPPQAPGNFQVTSSGSQAQLNWTEPGDPKIRYYNIYYSNTAEPPLTGDPKLDQRYRMASLPVGTNSYLDWLAAGGSGFYKITSVDRQGNEGFVSGPLDAVSPQSPEGLKLK